MKKELFKKFTVRWEENLNDGEKDVEIKLVGHLYINSYLYITLEIFFPVLEGLKCSDLLMPTCFKFSKTEWKPVIEKEVINKIQAYFEKYFKSSINFDLLNDEYWDSIEELKKWKDDDEYDINFKYAIPIKRTLEQLWQDWDRLEKVIEEYISKTENKKKIFREYKKWLKEAYKVECEDKVYREQIAPWITAFSFIE